MKFRIEPSGATLEFEPEVIIAAGYTGRDQAAVRAHIEELAREGVAPPASVPAYFVIPPGLLTQADRILAIHERTSGEAEVAYLVSPQGIFVTPASDHTDREAEKVDVPLSKVACQKIVGRSVWLLDEVQDHWDDLELVSQTGDGDLTSYQQASLGALLAPQALLGIIPWHERPRSFAVLGGTVPAKGGMRFARGFRVELRDPRTQRSLSLEYEAVVSRYLKTR